MWLGHESVDTTRVYLEADLAMKEKILAKTMPYDGRPLVYKADDTLMTFLRSL
jgi:integrase/recombinase XerD